jgi:putative transposase
MRNSRKLVESIDLLRLAFRKTREAKPFRIDAMAVLPEHLHSIWTLPPNDSDYPGKWKAIKSIFTRELEKSGVLVGKRKDDSAFIFFEIVDVQAVQREAVSFYGFCGNCNQKD